MAKLTRIAPALFVTASLALTGCVAKGKDGESQAPETTAPSARDTLMDARKVFAETNGVHLVIESQDVPDDVDAVRGADGVGSHAPAFKGDFRARAKGINVTVPVVSVDGKMYVKLPLTPGFRETDPASLGAVDPATFFEHDKGIEKAIDETEDVAYDGEAKRDGNDVVRVFKGKLSGETVREVIGLGMEGQDFDVRYTVTQPSHQIRQIELTGPFFKENEKNTYRMKLDRYGESVDVQKP